MKPTRLPVLAFVLLGLLLAVPARAAVATATRTLYLVRHGFYDFQEGADDRVGNVLNALGREQAAIAAAHFAAFPVKFAQITSSEFTRARETGDLIAAKLGLPCARDGRLNECTPAGAGLAPASEQAAAAAQLEQAWQHFAVPAPDGPRHELLVCHGNVIRWFVCRALGADLKQWTQMEIANCGVTVIIIWPDGRTKLEVYNDASYLPLDKQTWSGRGPGWPLPAQPAPRK